MRRSLRRNPYAKPRRGAPAMENRQHDLMRQQMIAEVVADAVFLTAQLGKSAFAARVIEVMGKIPRHEFVPLELQPYAYLNSPLPVGYGKTISQPFIIALMTDLLELEPGGRMVIPTGIPDKQQLVLLEKTESGKLATREVLPVRFSELEEGSDFAGAA